MSGPSLESKHTPAYERAKRVFPDGCTCTINELTRELLAECRHCATLREIRDAEDAVASRTRRLLEAGQRLADAAKMPRNTRAIYGKELTGNWVAVPGEDFASLRDALSAYQEAAKP